ncbi:MAG: hypothetical protein NDJ89_18700 [Oligoflexia bacterium]|nr:hypothetical protein [Oligoflexia bacterium]
MALERKPERKPRDEPLSFRFTEESAKQLRALAAYNNLSQVEVIEQLLAQEFKTSSKKDPRGFQAVASKAKRSR